MWCNDLRPLFIPPVCLYSGSVLARTLYTLILHSLIKNKTFLLLLSISNLNSCLWLRPFHLYTALNTTKTQMPMIPLELFVGVQRCLMSHTGHVERKLQKQVNHTSAVREESPWCGHWCPSVQKHTETKKKNIVRLKVLLFWSKDLSKVYEQLISYLL